MSRLVFSNNAHCGPSPALIPSSHHTTISTDLPPGPKPSCVASSAAVASGYAHPGWPKWSCKSPFLEICFCWSGTGSRPWPPGALAYGYAIHPSIHPSIHLELIPMLGTKNRKKPRRLFHFALHPPLFIIPFIINMLSFSHHSGPIDDLRIIRTRGEGVARDRQYLTCREAHSFLRRSRTPLPINQSPLQSAKIVPAQASSASIVVGQPFALLTKKAHVIRSRQAESLASAGEGEEKGEVLESGENLHHTSFCCPVGCWMLDVRNGETAKG